MIVKVSHEISNQMIEDLIVTALEGGSNYWYFLTDDAIKIIKDATPKMEGEPLAIRLTKAVLMDDNVFVPVHDLEDEDDELGKISQKSIQDALNKMSESYLTNLDNILDENIDADDADIFFQLVVMNEIIFC